MTRVYSDWAVFHTRTHTVKLARATSCIAAAAVRCRIIKHVRSAILPLDSVYSGVVLDICLRSDWFIDDYKYANY